jgi:hypothetical protein
MTANTKHSDIPNDRNTTTPSGETASGAVQFRGELLGALIITKHSLSSFPHYPEIALQPFYLEADNYFYLCLVISKIMTHLYNHFVNASKTPIASLDPIL